MSNRNRLLLAVAIVVTWFVILSVISAHAYGASLHQKLARNAADELAGYRQQLKLLRATYEAEPGYLLAEDAYTHAVRDLEDFQSRESSIIEERLTNDLLEVRMDLFELGQSDVRQVLTTQQER